MRQCSDRGLRCSSKWAAEQLVGLRPASQLPADDQEMPAAATASAAADDEADEETLVARVQGAQLQEDPDKEVEIRRRDAVLLRETEALVARAIAKATSASGGAGR